MLTNLASVWSETLKHSTLDSKDADFLLLVFKMSANYSRKKLFIKQKKDIKQIKQADQNKPRMVFTGRESRITLYTHVIYCDVIPMARCCQSVVRDKWMQ